MVQEIHLYIGGKEVFFSEPPEILFTFQRIDYTNPTAIKNTFTKTITIEGTPENNDVFNEIYLLGRTQNVALFNPSKRIPFELYSNGDLIETGYARLDNVVKDGYKIEYEVTLFGGLGDFFYGLSYGFDYDNYDVDTEQSKDEELKLKDLTYYSPSADDDTEFNFNITKDAVYSAWYVLASDEGDDMWNSINFAPAYNGLPNDFDSDKVLINTSGYTGGCRVSVPSGATVDGVTYTGNTVVTKTTIPTGITVDETTYTAVGGYAFSELRESLTEWDIRDLRSYLQRPVLRVKAFINAVKRYAKEQGGYTLNLDPDFFNSNNPYYEKAWITLPMLQNLNGEYAEQEATGLLQVGIPESETTGSTRIGGGYHKTLTTTYNVSGFPVTSDKYKGGSITINFGMNATPLFPETTTVYKLGLSSTKSREVNYASTFTVQLVAYDENNNVVKTSKSHIFEDGRNISDNTRIDTGRKSNSDSIYHYGYFYNATGATGNADFVWYNNDGTTDSFTISLEDDDVMYTTLKLIITKNIRYTDGFVSEYGLSDYFHPVFDNESYWAIMANLPLPWQSQGYNIGVVKSSVIYKPDNDTMKSNQLITKKKLLSQDGTPCDYLISYCKLFNLYFDKDPVEKVVTIRTRANFYDGTVIDLEKLIDRSKEIEITPITAENKWYDFNYTQGDRCEFEKKYYDTWGTDFGKQKVKTEYNFDNSNKDLLEGNIYNNGAEVLEKSKYFIAKLNNTKMIPSFLHEWSDFKLFHISEGGIETPDEFYIGQPAPTEQRIYNVNGSRYDFYPKLQLHTTKNDPIDGSNVLVFYGGMKETVVTGNTPVYYNITDDIVYMYDVNSQTCWLYTDSLTDKNNAVIAKRLLNSNNKPILPVFNRYVMSGDTITHTWDFGKTNELFVPNIDYSDGYPTIYSRYWNEYITDLYDTRTRVVTAYVRLIGKVEGDWLKHFYYFDDSIWCLTKIEDYNVTSFDTTKCEFVKIMDMNDYTYWHS